MIPVEFKRFGARLLEMEFFITQVDDLTRVSSYVHDHFAEHQKPLKIKVTATGKRSLTQNALLWLWYGEIVKQVKERGHGDYSTDDIHEYFKDEFCPAKVITFGAKEKRVKSTRKLDKGEMMLYLNSVEQWSKNARMTLTEPIKSEYRELMERNS